MSRKIIGNTVGTTISLASLEKRMKPIKTINGASADKNGNINIEGGIGVDGQTPFIGENGNWWIGNEDTGVKAQGVQGEKGDPGEPGAKGEKGNDGVYILADGETIEDAPETADIIIDPNEEAPAYVQTVNGVAPDANGNVNVQGNFTEEDKAEIVLAVLDALPVYDGEYAVTPSTTEELTLLTAQTFVGANVKIAKIPYYEVTNNSGGTTANIGG